MNDTTTDSTALIPQTTGIVSAFVAKNHVAAHELPALIASVHGALTGLATGTNVAPVDEPPEHVTPAQIRKSIRPEALISFIDGASYKTLKRHLTKHGLTPESYRQRFGLPGDYPMVCASYSATRSELAKNLGLGQRGAADEPAPKASRRQTPQAAA